MSPRDSAALEEALPSYENEFLEIRNKLRSEEAALKEIRRSLPCCHSFQNDSYQGPISDQVESDTSRTQDWVATIEQAAGSHPTNREHLLMRRAEHRQRLEDRKQAIADEAKARALSRDAKVSMLRQENEAFRGANSGDGQGREIIREDRVPADDLSPVPSRPFFHKVVAVIFRRTQPRPESRPGENL